MITKYDEKVLSNLGFTKTQAINIIKLLDTEKGLILISGLAGSGKTTTLKAIFELFDQRERYINIFDQISTGFLGFIIKNTERLINKKKLFLDQSWATLSSSGNFNVVERVHSMLIADGLSKEQSKEKLADPRYISGLIHQVLIPSLCSKCKMSLEQIENSPSFADYDFSNMKNILKTIYKDKDEDFLARNIFLRHFKGCSHCHKGFGNNILAAEVVVLDEKLSKEMANSTELAYENWSKKNPTETLKTSARALVLKGLVDPADVVQICRMAEKD